MSAEPVRQQSHVTVAEKEVCHRQSSVTEKEVPDRASLERRLLELELRDEQRAEEIKDKSMQLVHSEQLCSSLQETKKELVELSKSLLGFSRE